MLWAAPGLEVVGLVMLWLIFNPRNLGSILEEMDRRSTSMKELLIGAKVGGDQEYVTFRGSYLCNLASILVRYFVTVAISTIVVSSLAARNLSPLGESVSFHYGETPYYPPNSLQTEFSVWSLLMQTLGRLSTGKWVPFHLFEVTELLVTVRSYNDPASYYFSQYLLPSILCFKDNKLGIIWVTAIVFATIGAVFYAYQCWSTEALKSDNIISPVLDGEFGLCPVVVTATDSSEADSTITCTVSTSTDEHPTSDGSIYVSVKSPARRRRRIPVISGILRTKLKMRLGDLVDTPENRRLVKSDANRRAIAARTDGEHGFVNLRDRDLYAVVLHATHLFFIPSADEVTCEEMYEHYTDRDERMRRYPVQPRPSL